MARCVLISPGANVVWPGGDILHAPSRRIVFRLMDAPGAASRDDTMQSRVPVTKCKLKQPPDPTLALSVEHGLDVVPPSLQHESKSSAVRAHTSTSVISY